MVVLACFVVVAGEATYGWQVKATEWLLEHVLYGFSDRHFHSYEEQDCVLLYE